jgi:hypothetical protein
VIFVPEDVLARFEQKQKLETSPIVTNMIKTDSEMFFNVCTDMDDAEKQKLDILREFGTVSESKTTKRRPDPNCSCSFAMKNGENDESETCSNH